MSFEGNLGERDLQEVLYALGQHGRTGILTVQGAREIIAISLLAGEVVSADALNESLEDGLGQILAEQETVGLEEFAGLAAEHQAGGGRVIDLLVERGYLSRPQLLDALRRHTQRLCQQALGWRQGEFKFYQGDEVAYEPGVTPLPVEELIDGTVGEGGADGGSARFPDQAVIFARGTTEFIEPKTGERMLDAIELYGGEAQQLYALVDGEQSIAELAEMARLPESRVQYYMYRWQRDGLVEEVGRRQEATGSGVADREAAGELLIQRVLEAETAERRGWGERLAGAIASLGLVRQRFEPWPARLLGLTLIGVFVTMLWSQPSRLALPFPWQDGLRRDLAKEQRNAAYFRIQRAANAYFLLYGGFPEDASEMVDLGLLQAGDLILPSGRPLRFAATAVSYVIQELREGEPVAETTLTETIAGNVLLDPDFGGEERSDEPPLVLLD